MIELGLFFGLFALLAFVSNTDRLKKYYSCDGLSVVLNSVFSSSPRVHMSDFTSYDGRNVIGIVDDLIVRENKHETSLQGVEMVEEYMSLPKNYYLMTHSEVEHLCRTNASVSLYVLSNMGYVRILDLEKANTSTYTGTGIIVAIFEEDEIPEYPQIYMFPILADLHHEHGNSSEFENRKTRLWKYEYPWNVSQPILNITGDVVGRECMDCPNATGIISTRLASRQVDVVSIYYFDQVNTVHFVAIVYTQNSLKFVRYMWDDFITRGSMPEVHYAKMVMPNIIGFEYGQYYNAKLYRSPVNADLYLVAGFHIEQKEAFDKFHEHHTLEFFPGQKYGPFLLVFDDGPGGELLVVENLIQENTEGYPYYHFTSVSAKDNKIVVGGNTYRSYLGAYEFNKDRASNVPWYSIISVFETRIVKKTNFGLKNVVDLAKLPASEKKENWVFNLCSVSYPVEGITDTRLIIAGGSIVSMEKRSRAKGVAVLLDIENEEFVHNVFIGKESSIVRHIIVGTQPNGAQRLYFDIVFNGDLTSLVLNETMDYMKTDLWSIQCKNPHVEQKVKISSWVFFSMVVVSFIVIVLSTCFLTVKQYFGNIKRKYNEAVKSIGNFNPSIQRDDDMLSDDGNDETVPLFGEKDQEK